MGSGGALGIGVGDRVAMLRILLLLGHQPRRLRRHPVEERTSTPSGPPRRCEFTSPDLLRLGVVDHVIEEPLGGAHRDHHQMAMRLKQYPAPDAPRTDRRSTEQLLDARYEKFRRMGVFLEGPAAVAASGEA